MADNKTPTVEDRISAMESTIDQQSKTIDALTARLEKSGVATETKTVEIPKIPEETFTVNKRTFKFVVAAFIYKNEKVTALDALADKDMLGDLVAKGSGVISEVF